MTYKPKLTGDRKTDDALIETYRVINLLENRIKKCADKKLLDDLIIALKNTGDLPGLKFWRRVEDDDGNLSWEFDANLGVGEPDWTPYRVWHPSLD